MPNAFGSLVRKRRMELRLSLRECAARATMDPGNLSKIERGRAAPPQDADVLARLVDALGLTGSPGAQRLLDVAATSNGRIPQDIVRNDDVLSALPLLLRAVNDKLRDGARAEALIELIRNA